MNKVSEIRRREFGSVHLFAPYFINGRSAEGRSWRMAYLDYSKTDDNGVAALHIQVLSQKRRGTASVTRRVSRQTSLLSAMRTNFRISP